MGKILITGATGFIGSGLLKQLDCRKIVTVGRQATAEQDRWQDYHVKFDGQDDYQQCLSDITVVIHLAASSHAPAQPSQAQRDQIVRSNVDATIDLARQAQAHGVERFIFVSSAKVNGECSPSDAPFSQDCQVKPEGLYAQTKLLAEQGLLTLTQGGSMELVILRPPVVYGPGVKGNFASLLRLAQSPLYLPLAGIKNRRSMIYLDNLISAIICCIEHPGAANKIFMLADQDAISTSQLIAEIRKISARPERLISAPKRLLKLLLTLLNKPAVYDSLFGNLEVDSSHIASQLGWTPLCTWQQGLQKTLLPPQ